MSEEQLTALLAKLKDDAGLQEKLKGATDLNAAVAMAQEAGFDVSKVDWLKYHTKQYGLTKLNDEELERVSGGAGFYDYANGLIDNWIQKSMFEGDSWEEAEINWKRCHP